MYDVIILGAGPAGLTAAIYACRAGYKTLVLEKAYPGGQVTTTFEVDNYPGMPTVTGMELSMKMSEHARTAGAEIRTAEVKELNIRGKVKKVITAKETIEGRSIIICSGATRRKGGFSGEDELAGRGISYCATCDGGFFRGKDVAVMGGGNTALEDALYLNNICNKVYLVHRRDQFRGTKHLQNKIFASDKIVPVYDSVIEEVRGDGKVESMIVKNKKTQQRTQYAVSAVFVAIGTEPTSSLLEGVLEMDASGRVIAGEDGKTAIPGVFVAGDVRHKQLFQIITAAADGANAVKSATDYLG